MQDFKLYLIIIILFTTAYLYYSTYINLQVEYKGSWQSIYTVSHSGWFATFGSKDESYYLNNFSLINELYLQITLT